MDALKFQLVRHDTFVTGGGGGGGVLTGSSILCSFFPSQFSPKKYDILQVYFWPDFWSLTVCSESHKSSMVACVLVR